MRIFRHYDDIPADARGAVVAIGNFDGVHRGHQALIGEARGLAREQGKLLGVVAFEPHPQEYFHPGAETFRVTPFRTKARLIAEQGADVMYALHFDAAMARMNPQDFVLDVLVKGLGIGHAVVGADFQFGKGRAGDAAVLGYMGEMEGFETTIFRPVEAEMGEKISSTRIRDALKAGRPDEAARLLGHWWTVEGRVEHGDGRGRTIGIPTANMRLEGYLKPAYGVYAVRAQYEEESTVRRFDGVANFGIRPMFRTAEPLLEVHLFDFAGDLYGRHLAVEFVRYLRGEETFDSLDVLKARMAEDCDAARRALGTATLDPQTGAC